MIRLGIRQGVPLRSEVAMICDGYVLLDGGYRSRVGQSPAECFVRRALHELGRLYDY
jgi:hypothetical protein